jgi:hypothetical protein
MGDRKNANAKTLKRNQRVGRPDKKVWHQTHIEKRLLAMRWKQ